MIRRRPLLLGAALVAAYAMAAGLTLQLVDRHVRPLFEGIGPSAPYQWVNPPTEFEAGNVKPGPAVRGVLLTQRGSSAGGGSTDDGQVVLNLPDGAFAASPEDISVRIQITPLDPARLAKVPGDLRADGNAYRIEADYSPSRRPIASSLVRPGNIILRLPEPFVALLYSPDGQTWVRLQAASVGTRSTVTGELPNLGFYLGAASASTVTPQRGGGSGNLGIAAVAAITVALSLGLALGPVAYRRLRGQRTAPLAARSAPPTDIESRRLWLRKRARNRP